MPTLCSVQSVSTSHRSGERVSDSRLHHRRFFVPAERIHDGRVEFLPGQSHQMAHVLRLRPGDQVRVFDGTGREFVAALLPATSKERLARILGEEPTFPHATFRLTLAQVVPRGPAMDWIVAKATELGVSCIIPLEGERSVRHPAPTPPSRWLRIVQEATEQCGRRDLPAIAPACSVEALLRAHLETTPLLVCDAGRESRPLLGLCEALAGTPSLTLVVGGEGGLGSVELERLRSRGAHLASLGPRILRTETAVVAALSVIQAVLGDSRSIRGTEGIRSSLAS